MLGLDNPIHLLFLGVIVLLLFGAKRLPEMGRSLGEGLRGFKESVSGDSTSTTGATELSGPVAEPLQADAPAAAEGVHATSLEGTPLRQAA